VREIGLDAGLDAMPSDLLTDNAGTARPCCVSKRLGGIHRPVVFVHHNSPVGALGPSGQETDPSRRYRALVDDTWPRPCAHCGLPYDGRLRGIDGRFHMAAFRVERASGSLDLVGHWREGVLPETGEFVLTKAGQGDLSFTATPLRPPSDSASKRGQLALRVLVGSDGLAEADSSHSCVWGND
jgi:hypothetical protein